jgi:hypothetical protein
LRYNDIAALEVEFSANGHEICAVILEPMQGEGGMTPGTPEYLQAARRLCSAHGALLILDEIQSGMGRTGALFSYMQKGIVPDILTSAKGLGGGFPVGAMLTTADIASAFSVGVHGTTYGGNPLACAVAGAVFDVINTTEVLDGVKARHALFMEGLRAINARRPVFRDLRGEGVWIGCELADAWRGKAGDVVKAAGAAGLLVLMAGPDVVRIAARELQCGLVRLGARIAEEHALGERRIGEAFREPQRRLVGEPVRHMPQRARLRFERADHRRMAMAERGDGDACGEIDVHPPVLVPHARAFTAHRNERRGREARDHHLVEQCARDGQRCRFGMRRRGIAPRGLGNERSRAGGQGHRRIRSRQPAAATICISTR